MRYYPRRSRGDCTKMPSYDAECTVGRLLNIFVVLYPLLMLPFFGCKLFACILPSKLYVA